MKIGIIGLGSVGSAVATAIYNTGLVREMVFSDKDGVRAVAAAEDLSHATTFGFDIKINATGGYSKLKDSDVVIISAGANQKPTQKREDLLSANIGVMKDVVSKIMKNVNRNKVVLIVVTNPLDAMTTLVQRLSGLPESRVIGTGTMLDSARFRSELARNLQISPSSINAFALGEHGDNAVLNWSSVSVGGVALEEFCKQTKNSLSSAVRKTIEYRVKNSATEIIKGRGATWDGIAAATADLVRAIVNDEKRVLSVSTVQNGVAMSMLRIVCASGAIDTLIPKLSLIEVAALRKAEQDIKNQIAKI